MTVYPYYIYTKQPGAEATQNLEGDFVASTPSTWLIFGRGRDEINSQAKRITLTNGENIEYHAIIYSDKREVIPIGTDIIVSEDKLDESQIADDAYLNAQNLRIKGTVKGCSKSRLNLRIWV